MRSSEAFVLGMIAGGVVAWRWGREIQRYAEAQTRGMRHRAANRIQAVDDTAGQVLDRGGDTLRRAEGFLQDTKENVSEVLRAGQDIIRPASPPT